MVCILHPVTVSIRGILQKQQPLKPPHVFVGQACNNFKLSNGKAVEMCMKALESAHGGAVENDLVRHNKVVFQNGEGALQVTLLPEPGEFSQVDSNTFSCVERLLKHQNSLIEPFIWTWKIFCPMNGL